MHHSKSSYIPPSKGTLIVTQTSRGPRNPSDRSVADSVGTAALAYRRASPSVRFRLAPGRVRAAVESLRSRVLLARDRQYKVGRSRYQRLYDRVCATCSTEYGSGALLRFQSFSTCFRPDMSA